MSAEFNSQGGKKPKKERPKKATTAALGDLQSETLIAEASQLGNAEMQRQLKASKQSRDALLETIVGRLTNLRQLQLKENDLLGKRDEWFIAVHLGKDSLPDPARWSQAARGYKEAALALCRGDISRGISLLQKALAEEAKAQKSLPKKMGPVEKPPRQIPVDSNTPKEAAPCTPPQGLVIADRILSLTPAVDDASTRKKRLHDWFGPEVEEEEEDGENASG